MSNNKGYLILAVNNDTIDYVKCASTLAKTIREWHPCVKICLLTDKKITNPIFDIIKILPHGDIAVDNNWKLSNDWQAYEASPFDETIKLEADMWAASPIDHWWELFGTRNLIISQGARDFYDNCSNSRFYRGVFDANELPDVYNAITYWRKSSISQEFFTLVREIFEQWDTYKKLLIYPDKNPTTDVVYAMAANIIGIEKVILPKNFGPKIVHMKQRIIPTVTDDWTKEIVFEHTEPGIRINTVAQWGFVHYHVKDCVNNG